MTVNHIHTVITDSGVTEFVDADELDCVAEWIKNYSTELKLYDQRRVWNHFYSGTCPTYTIVDECHETKGHEIDGPKNIYWHQPIPSADPSNKPVSDPSKTKRAKLRAKRKNR